jgi:8-oxo-dGTP pyrophosphatase MutT (NUDIX family)
MSKIRPLAIAIIRNEKGQILLHEGFDSVKKENFYRPLGGGVEFGELGEQALRREFQEEIGESLADCDFLTVFENIFTYEGKPGHEIVLLFEARLANPAVKETYPIMESEGVVGQAVWKSLEEIHKQRAKIYPMGIEEFI